MRETVQSTGPTSQETEGIVADSPQKIELRHIRCFLAAAEHGSFRKAGATLGIQESSVSRRIRDLEDQLGVSLFQRYNGGVRLTVAGDKFESRARAILGQVSEGVADLSSIGRGMDGRVRIGLVAPIANGFPAYLLREFGKSHEGVRIELVDAEPVVHINAIRRFDLDVAFLIGARPWGGCDVIPLWSGRIFVLLPEHHPLSRYAELSWMDLVDESFIVPGTALGQELRSLVMARLADLGHAPSLQPQSVGSDNLVPLVALGRGVLLSTGMMAEGEHSGVIVRPITGEALQFSAVWSPRNDNPAFRRFLGVAKALCARSPGTSSRAHQ